MNNIKLFENFKSSDFYTKYIKYYIKKTDQNYSADEFNKIIEILEKDCSVFLNELKSLKQYPFFRGSKYEKPTNGFILKDVDINRKPKDTIVEISDKLDNEFYKKFGINIRRRGTFSTKIPAVAEGYGDSHQDVYIFIPIGKYEYFWNESIDDLFTNLRDNHWYEDICEILKGDMYTYNKLYGTGSNKGSWFFNEIDYGTPLSYAVSSFKEDNNMKGKSNRQIENMLIWVPEISEEEYIDNLFLIADEYISKCVNGYKKGNIDQIEKQEMTFICNQYYLIDLKFYNSLVNYLNLEI